MQASVQVGIQAALAKY